MTVALIGLFVGFAIGLTGVGGGVLIAPLLMLAAGLPPAESVGTALVASAAIKIYAAVHYFFRRQVDLKVLGRLIAGGAPGVLAGSLCLKGLADERFTRMVLALVGATVCLTAGFSLWQSIRPKPAASLRIKRLSPFAFLIGLEVGFSSAGAGALGTVLLFNGTTLAPAAVVGTDLAFGLVLSLTGGLMHALLGSWQPALLGRLIIGGLAGAFCGISFTAFLPPRRLRQIVLACAAMLGIALVIKGL